MSQGYRVSTGRGGAGNMHFSNEKISSPKIIPEGSQTPSILSPVYSTGRGGAGNMRKNIDPAITRKAQDVGDLQLPHHHSHNHHHNNSNNNKKLNRHNDKNKDSNRKNHNANHMDTIEDTIPDLDVANEPFIASLESNTMEPLTSRHSQLLYQVTRSHTRNGDDDEDAIIVDEEDYIAPITNEDLFEDNNISRVTNVLSNIRSHISPMASSNKDTTNQQEKVKFINADPKQQQHQQQHRHRSGGGAGSNSNKLRLIKTVSHSKDGTAKTITLKKNRRKSSHGGNSSKSPPPIVIGRGGAGNIVSPINTNSTHSHNISVSNSNKKKSSSPSSSAKGKGNSNNNIPSQNKEKKGFLSSIMNIFA